jgi:hypothetical protein
MIPIINKYNILNLSQLSDSIIFINITLLNQ